MTLGRNGTKTSIAKMESDKETNTHPNPFAGHLAAYKKCHRCGLESLSDPIEFMQLSLSIPPNQLGNSYSACSLSSCYEYFSTPEHHMLDCDQCRFKAHCFRQEKIDRVPKVLSFHVKRLVQGVATGGHLVRITRHLDFPLHFRLSDLTSKQLGSKPSTAPTGYAPIHGGHSAPHLPLSSPSPSSSPATPPSDKMTLAQPNISLQSSHENIFHLMAVIVHHPSFESTNGGHFTTYRRLLSHLPYCDASTQRDCYENYVRNLFTPSDKWIHISDEDFRYVDVETVLSAEAYMLFYEM